MIPLIMAIAGAALGKLNHDHQESEFEREKRIQAETTRMSPWTHMQAAAAQAPQNSELGEMGGGALSGYMFGKQFDKSVPNTQNTTSANPEAAKNVQMADGMNKYSLMDSPYNLNPDQNSYMQMLKQRSAFIPRQYTPNMGLNYTPWMYQNGNS